MTLDETLPTTGTDPPADNFADTTGQTREVNGRWEKLCSNCEEWIGLGPKGSEHSFFVHQRNKRCQRAMERKTHQEAKAALESLMPPPSAIPPPFPSPSSRVLTTPPHLTSGPSCESGSQEDLLPDPSSLLLGPSTLPSSPTALVPLDLPSSASPSPSPDPFPHLFTPSSLDAALTMDGAAFLPVSSHLPPLINASHISQTSSGVAVRLPCDGVRFKWEHGSLFLSYPLQYHETGCPNWSLDGVGEKDNSYMARVRSHSCARLRDPFMEACPPCTNIVPSRGFQNMLQNVSKDPPPNTPYMYLNWKQLEAKLRCTIKELQLERKQVWLFVENVLSIFLLSFVEWCIPQEDPAVDTEAQ